MEKKNSMPFAMHAAAAVRGILDSEERLGM